jgi:voltage-gated potassium channel
MSHTSNPSRRQRYGFATYELLPASWQGRWAWVERELRDPSTELTKRYTVTVLFTIVASIFFLFVAEEYPAWFPMQSTQTFVVELLILLIFGVDYVLNAMTVRVKDWRAMLLLTSDFLAVLPSAIVVMVYLGWIQGAHVEGLVLLRLFRLMRVVKLLRVGNTLIEVMGASVFTLVFGTMAAHLGFRVLLLELGNALHYDLLGFFERPILLLAVGSVGSVFGIALAITFGIVKRKQMEITELHRTAMDALNQMEHDFNTVLADAAKDKPAADFDGWRHHVSLYLVEEVSYEKIKAETRELLNRIRAVVATRPSMDVPFHAVLVQRISTFLTRTQVCFHPAFYQWLRRISNLYFVLVMLAAPGLTGLAVQMLVIFVFAGLVIIIDDMDHAVDKSVVIFNSKILPV